MNRNPLKIVVLKGSQQGEEFYLSKRITRLGSDAGCEICILGDGIPGHLLSIEVGPDDIVVYNRAEITVTLGGQVIGPQVSGIWKQGKDLLLPGKVSLRLEAYSAKPVATSKQVELEEYDASPDADPSKPTKAAKPVSAKSGKSNAGPIAFIVACLVLVILLIIKKAGGDMSGPVTAAGTALNWEQVWADLTSDARLAQPEFDDLRRDFQHLYRLRNNPASTESPRWKSRILQNLIAGESSLPEPDREFNRQLRSFVNKL